jgi:predicted dehydrogenase
MRSSTQYGQAIRKIREGAIGEVIMVKAQRHATADLDHQGTSADWYFDVTKSGGYLIEQSVHNLDLCNWVIGAHPLRACGFGGILLYKNDPPGRTIFDCGSLTYEYPNGVKMSFTQNVFHPGAMPNGGQYVYVYGTKGAVDLTSGGTLYPLDRKIKPVELAQKEPVDNNAHIAAFYACVTKGGGNPADIVIGATAALTSILGHEAMTKERVVTWADLGVKV